MFETTPALAFTTTRTAIRDGQDPINRSGVSVGGKKENAVNVDV